MKGKLLLAKPFLEDENFVRSVILICEYGPDGIFGLIVNQETDYVFSDLFENIEIDAKINIGGPVGSNTLHYLHKRADVKGAVEVISGVFWSGDFDEIQYLIQNGEISKKDIRFFLGYSGWDYTQFQEELKDNVWIVANSKTETIFDTDIKQIWPMVLRSLGKEYIIMANTPIDVRLN